MRGEARKALLADFIREVWSQGRIEACDTYLAQRYTIHHDPGDPWDGQQLDRAGFKERVRQSRAPFPDQRFDLRELLADGDAVAAAWLWSATQQGVFAGFPPSGHRLKMSGITIYYFDAEDRITGHWQVADRLGVWRQLSSGCPA